MHPRPGENRSKHGTDRSGSVWHINWANDSRASRDRTRLLGSLPHHRSVSGNRRASNRSATAVVALRGDSGEHAHEACGESRQLLLRGGMHDIQIDGPVTMHDAIAQTGRLTPGDVANCSFTSADSWAEASPRTVKFHSKASRRIRSAARSCGATPFDQCHSLVGRLDHLLRKQDITLHTAVELPPGQLRADARAAPLPKTGRPGARTARKARPSGPRSPSRVADPAEGHTGCPRQWTVPRFHGPPNRRSSIGQCHTASRLRPGGPHPQSLPALSRFKAKPSHGPMAARAGNRSRWAWVRPGTTWPGWDPQQTADLKADRASLLPPVRSRSRYARGP